jgi:hypothetical protein
MEIVRAERAFLATRKQSDIPAKPEATRYLETGPKAKK